MNPDLFWIPGPWPGRLAVIGRPRGGDWLEDEVSAWQTAGLDVIVSLLEPEEAAQLELLAEETLAQSKNVQFISFPIPDRGVPASTRDVLVLFAKIAGKLEEGKKVAIHCRQSVGRSGMAAAGLLITAGMGVDQAIEVVSAARGQDVPETVEQLRWIRHLPAEQLALTLQKVRCVQGRSSLAGVGDTDRFQRAADRRGREAVLGHQLPQQQAGFGVRDRRLDADPH